MFVVLSSFSPASIMSRLHASCHLSVCLPLLLFPGMSTPYTITTSNQPNTAKYLGIHIDSTLKLNTHINKTAQRANTTSAFLHRNIRTCPRKIKHLAYTTLVRPILEYASIIWDPHTDSNTLKLETVQRRSARRIMQNYNRHASVTHMLQNLDLPTCTTTTPPPFQNHHAIQNQTPISQHSNHHLHHTSHPEHSTLQPAICPHRCIQIILLPKHHQTMEQPTTCNNQQHNHTTI